MTWRESFSEKAAFAKVRKAENNYSLRLRKIASHIHDLVVEFANNPEFPQNIGHLEFLLTQYSAILEPWARSVANRFLAEVARRDEKAWYTYSKKLSYGIEQEILTASTGQMLQDFLETQVDLITSLPLEAAERVHEISVGNLYGGSRFAELAKHIMETGHVTKNRANLIARTETARVSSALTMVRSQAIGANQYIWRTVGDIRVRDSHHRMEGKVIDWSEPPEVEPGKYYHAGQYINCRCYPEIIIPDIYLPRAS